MNRTRKCEKLTDALSNLADEKLKSMTTDGFWIRKALWDEAKNVSFRGHQYLYVLVMPTGFADVWLRLPFVFEGQDEVNLNDRDVVERLAHKLWSLKPTTVRYRDLEDDPPF